MITPQTVAVTGASGFLGRAVCAELARRGYRVRRLLRGTDNETGNHAVCYKGLEDEAALRPALAGVDAVVHLAARVHRMREHEVDPLSVYRRTNTEATRRLAMWAAEAGVREFLFASSVKAMGEGSDRRWTETDVPSPKDAYGISKLEAEAALAEETRGSGMATAVLRLPVAYGPGMKANMYRLFLLVDRGIPLPVGGIENRRSLVYSGNVATAFAGLLGLVRGHELFFVSDAEDVSTAELIRRIADALGRPARVLQAPGMIRLLAHLNIPALSPGLRRLTGSLTVDSSRLCARIGPPTFSMMEGLRETAAWYRTTVR